ncbi:MAG: 16S rRNA (cytosine(1402)-N(4))-methyltransferase, partial [Anaerolineae bacterium]|nr:16S rRNA (cytosine(1402)-N(4))-methyltransferase [Anaerolineae bacterium]
IKEVARKPIRPSAEEVDRNPRARSAILRVVEKVSK